MCAYGTTRSVELMQENMKVHLRHSNASPTPAHLVSVLIIAGLEMVPNPNFLLQPNRALTINDCPSVV
jgi:hypothetical protein